MATESITVWRVLLHHPVAHKEWLWRVSRFGGFYSTTPLLARNGYGEYHGLERFTPPPRCSQGMAMESITVWRVLLHHPVAHKEWLWRVSQFGEFYSTTPQSG
ncbi:hypothetical protein PoB_000252200 [Plakobranchus ocellatus]|uniref:Uncharacterized protein n=1 Tax=Plakobranchus ocellatus TaxID=259542 RepID=A0AAV3Y0Q4_9GAST|nr:hypothetical protein PoB_000252200 [Plakobranchus ocellatus]